MPRMDARAETRTELYGPIDPHDAGLLALDEPHSMLYRADDFSTLSLIFVDHAVADKLIAGYWMLALGQSREIIGRYSAG